VVCKSCGRDLRLVIPVIEENLSLIQRASALQLQVNRLRAAEKRAAAPLWFLPQHGRPVGEKRRLADRRQNLRQREKRG